MCQHQQDPAVEADAVTAGIPLSGEVLTAAGQRLIALLVEDRTAEFVPHVQQVIQEASRQQTSQKALHLLHSPETKLHMYTLARSELNPLMN